MRQQFKAAQPLAEALLKQLKGVEGLRGPLSSALWDDADAVAAYTGDKLACVIFPTADTMDRRV